MHLFCTNTNIWSISKKSSRKDQFVARVRGRVLVVVSPLAMGDAVLDSVDVVGAIVVFVNSDELPSQQVCINTNCRNQAGTEARKNNWELNPRGVRCVGGSSCLLLHIEVCILYIKLPTVQIWRGWVEHIRQGSS